MLIVLVCLSLFGCKNISDEEKAEREEALKHSNRRIKFTSEDGTIVLNIRRSRFHQIHMEDGKEHWCLH
jgi:hypothetical protein